MDIPKELLSKDFLGQFKTEEDVSNFLTDLHSRVLEQMLEGEMDAHLGYEFVLLCQPKTKTERNEHFYS